MTAVTVDGFELELTVIDGLLTVVCGEAEAAVRIAEPAPIEESVND